MMEPGDAAHDPSVGERLPVRILHIVNEVCSSGNGIVNVVVDLACEQSVQGHTVCVASGGGEFVSLLEKNGVRHFVLDLRRRLASLPLTAFRYRKLLTEFEPDVVHAHTLSAAVVGRTLRWNTCYRLVTTVHNEYQTGVRLMGLGDAVVCVSHAVRFRMAQRGIPGGQLRTVLNGVIGTHRRPAANEESVPFCHPAIVAVGALTKRKGCDVLIDAFDRIAATFPQANLYFVGNRDAPWLESYASKMESGERIHFVGFVSNPKTLLLRADVFVMASRREPFGLVLLEARQAGTPIIASDVDGIPEALDGGTAGYLVPPDDGRALAAGLRRVLGSSELRRALSSRGKEGLDYFSVTRMCNQYLRIYKEVIESVG